MQIHAARSNFVTSQLPRVVRWQSLFYGISVSKGKRVRETMRPINLARIISAASYRFSLAAGYLEETLIVVVMRGIVFHSVPTRKIIIQVCSTNVKLRELCAPVTFFHANASSVLAACLPMLNCTVAFCTRAETFSLVLKRQFGVAVPRVKCLFIQSRNFEVFLSTSSILFNAPHLFLPSLSRDALFSA